MNSKDAIKYALLALGVYLIWQYSQAHGGISALLGMTTPTVPPPPPGVHPPGTTTTPPPPPATTTQPPPPPPPPSGPPAPPPPTQQSFQNLYDRIGNAAQGTDPSFLHYDGWCYYFSQVTGQGCPDPGEAFPALDRTAPMTLDQWWGLMGPWLNQNLPGLQGLGAWGRGPVSIWLM